MAGGSSGFPSGGEGGSATPLNDSFPCSTVPAAAVAGDKGGPTAGGFDGRRLDGGGSSLPLNGSFPFSTETAAARGDKGGPSVDPSGGKKAGGKKGKKQTKTKAKKGAVATKRSSHPFVAACERELDEASPGEMGQEEGRR